LRHCGACAGRHVTPQGAAYPGALTLAETGFLALFSKFMLRYIYGNRSKFLLGGGNPFQQNLFFEEAKKRSIVYMSRDVK
jgi:hypothetical protein